MRLQTAGCVNMVASFPGPAQLSITCSTEATESWMGPGNEAINMVLLAEYSVDVTSKVFHFFPHLFLFPLGALNDIDEYRLYPWQQPHMQAFHCR